MTFKRKIYGKLLNWKADSQWRSALQIGYRKHSSLDEFCLKYSDRISEKFLVYTKDYARREGVDYLPFYMAQFL